ncbi:MAG: YbfB/YjiJ family MFS transporter [Desulfobacterales bacterium]|nr:YbfB/YjiJ family MFS transporter [Desulfobacterales bacterium]
MKAIHYGWVIVGVGVLVKMTSLGFGRFAYPMLLPSMRGSLGFNYSEMGLLSGAIMLGYLLFSLIGGMLATRLGPKRIVIASLLCGALSMFFISRLSEFSPLLFFSFAMGAGAAGSHISITTLPMAWFEERRLGRAVGVVTGGTGLGIIVTGLLLPYLLFNLGKEAWRECWFLLALITFLVAVIGWVLLREKPNLMAFLPPSLDGDNKFHPSKRESHELTLKAIFIIYFIFGFAYNIYATYFVAYMIEEIRLTAKTAGDIWAIFGWMCTGSGLIWGFVSDRLGRRKALLWNNGIISLSVLLPLLLYQPFFMGFSALLFGGTFLGTVTIIAAAIGDQVSEKRASVYGLVTLIHGTGQFLGTISGGYLKDLTGSFQLTLIVSLTGFLLCLVLTVINKKG